MVEWGPTTVFGSSSGSSTALTTTNATPNTPSVGASGSAFSFGTASGGVTTPVKSPSTSAAPFGSPATLSFGSTTTFGSMPAAAAPVTSSIFQSFGTTTPPTTTASTSFGGFGGAAPAPAPVATPQQQAMIVEAQRQAEQRQEMIRIEANLTRLRAAYGSTTANVAASFPTATPTDLPFHRVFHDVGGGGRSSLHAVANIPRPSYVSEEEWIAALATDEDGVVLAPSVGADALAARLVEQQRRADQLSSVLTAHQTTLREASERLRDAGRDARYAASEHDAVRRRLLEVLRRVESLRCRNLPLQPDERDLATKMAQVAKVATRLTEKTRQMEDETEAYKRGLAARERERGRRPVANRSTPLTANEKECLFKVMDEQRVGLEKLVNAVKTDLRDVAIIKKLLADKEKERMRM